MINKVINQSGDEALSYYENTASFAGSENSVILLAMMTETGYAGKDMVDKSNYDEIVATLEEINITKDENGIWHTPFAYVLRIRSKHSAERKRFQARLRYNRDFF